MKELYISPELEIWCFVSRQKLANGASWYNEQWVETEEGSADETIPGGIIPGWGN